MKILITTSLLILGASVSGCANRLLSDDPYGAGNLSVSQDLSAPGNADLSQFQCPSNPNVLPEYDQHLDGTGQYTACASTASTADLLLHGQTVSSTAICVYPAQYVDATHIFTKPDPSTGAPIYSCQEISPDGVKVSFPSVNYNMVFVVEQPNRQAMSNCLITHDYTSCPVYSYGRFR